MGRNTKIDWCDSTWNPVTGCLHGCEYCYARRIAERFSCEGQTLDAPAELQRVWLEDGGPALRQNGCHVLRYPVRLLDSDRICPYPFAFTPTFHRYKLDEPQRWKRLRNVFVCSMADLFGKWVPDEWIRDVFEACKMAAHHRYMFLTKAPERYAVLKKAGIIPPAGSWIGTSVVCDADARDDRTSKIAHLGENWNMNVHWFVSVEPILECLSRNSIDNLGATHWVIIGAETGNRHDKVVPEKSWVMDIADTCKGVGTPVFMKESLRKIMGNDFRQEFPWDAAMQK